MPTIMPLSDLRNYNTVLEHVTDERPVVLTKNGRGRYAVVDISAFERLNAELKLVSALVEGESSAARDGWVSARDAKRRFGGPLMAGVVYSPKALADIERIRDHIRDALLNPEASTKFVSDVFDAGDSLAEKPRPGASFRSDQEILSYYRYLTVGRYLLVYRVQNDKALVVRVLHELQDSLSILLREAQ